jgi:hypothetical protein
MQASDHREAARAAFDDAGREVTQAFDTLANNLTLAGGTLAALLAVIGAGELFGRQPVVVSVNGSTAQVQAPGPPMAHGLPEFTNASLLLLAVALPLVVRFFIRATFGYQQLLRFNKVRSAQWRFLSGQHTWAHARGHYDVYVVAWRSPETPATLFWGSAKFGFVWVFFLYALVLGWAFYTASGVLARVVAGAAILIGIGFEIITLRRSDLFGRPTAAQTAETVPGPGPPPGVELPGATGGGHMGIPASDQIELFMGVRRRGRRSRAARPGAISTRLRPRRARPRP